MNSIPPPSCLPVRAAASALVFRNLRKHIYFAALCGVLGFVLGGAGGGMHAQTAHFAGEQRVASNSANNGLALMEALSNGEFGAVKVGSTSPTPISLIFTFNRVETLGSTAVVTQGAPGLDFADAGTGTCKAGSEYNPGNTCTVNVSFSPKFAGTRYGAAELLDGSGNLIAAGYLQGTGVGPQVSFPPGIQSIVVNSGFNSEDFPIGVAVDGSGNVYIAFDKFNGSRVLKETLSAGGYIESVVADAATNGLSSPTGVSVDGGGNVYICDYGNDQVLKETPSAGGYTQSVVADAAGNGLDKPAAVAVDGSGNVYIADNSDDRVLKETLSAGGYAQSVVADAANNGLNGAHGVAVDGSGNVYIADYGNDRVLKETLSGGGYTQSVVANAANNGLQGPLGIAVDGSGNVYIADSGIVYFHVFKETLSAGGYTQSVVANAAGNGLNQPQAVAVDGSGNFYIADTQNNRVLKEDLADWPSLTFNSAAVGGTSTDSPRTAQVENTGNATLLLNALTYPTDFPEADDDSNPCTNLTSLRPGGLCHLHIDFKPLSVGSPLSEDVTITDNALNETGAQQAVAVSGTALDMATHLSVTAPPNAAAEKAFAITVAALNASGGVAPGFSGTVNFSSTDPIAVLPGASTLKPGVGTFLVTLNTPGEQTITVTDRANSFTAITGTINVSAAPPGVFPARSSVNFGLQAIGSTSGAQMLSFFIGAGTTVGSVEVLTQGSPNLDFASAAGTTCKTQQYSSGTNCAVDVVFTPKGTGTRYGAVVFLDGSGNVLATVYLQGRGSGPQIQFVPGTQSAFPNPASEYQPEGVAVDGSGSVYIADAANDTVYKETLTEGSFTLSVVARFVADGLTAPLLAVALDGAGNLYIVDSNDAQVLKATPSAGGYTLSVIANSANNGLSYPGGVAVDGSGNVYIDDVSGTRVLKETLSEGGYTQSVIADNATNGLIDPYGVAVDANGNVYIADSYNKRVLKETLSEGRYTQSVVADNATNGLIDPQGIAVDGSGNVYICDGQVFKETPSGGGYSQSVIASVASNGLDYPLGVAVDGNGNVYIADFYSFRVLKEDLADPPSLTFPDTAVGTSTSYSPRRVTLNNEGNAALIFALPGSGDNPSVSAGFEWDSSSTCMQTTTSSVAAYELVGGAHCSMAFDFAPTMSGNFFGFAKLVDNNLNVNGAVQSIQLTGTGFQRSQTITFPQPASPVYYGVAPIVLSATGGASGNPVIFSMISGPGSLSGTNDSVLTVTGVGTVVIAANQAGDTDYTAAPQVTRSITVLLSKHAALTAPAP